MTPQERIDEAAQRIRAELELLSIDARLGGIEYGKADTRYWKGLAETNQREIGDLRSRLNSIIGLALCAAALSLGLIMFIVVKANS